MTLAGLPRTGATVLAQDHFYSDFLSWAKHAEACKCLGASDGHHINDIVLAGTPGTYQINVPVLAGTPGTYKINEENRLSRDKRF